MTVRGVIIDYDFAVLNGAEILFETTKKYLRALDKIPFDDAVEARYLAGRDMRDGLAAYFATIKTKKTAAKAARELAASFVSKLNDCVTEAPSGAFLNFVRTLVDAGLRVAIATRADIAPMAEPFASVLGPEVSLYHEESTIYGSVKMDSWRRTCVANRMNARSLVVAGSGLGVKSALIAGLGSVAVMNDRVAYQDFSGADALLKKLDGPAARRVLAVMRLA